MQENSTCPCCAETERTLNNAFDEINRLNETISRMVTACVIESWRQVPRTLANVDDSGVYEHSWEWRLGHMSGNSPTRSNAVDALMMSIGAPVEIDNESG